VALDIEAIRAQIPVTSRTAYLNTGTASPWCTPVVDAIKAALEREQALGRASPAGLPDFAPLVTETRAKLAALIGADADEIALTHSTTEGVDVAVWGLDLQRGDEVVTTSIEHRGIQVPLRQLADRRGVVVTTVDVGRGEPLEALDALHEAITDRTRLVALSHVSFSTGAVLPIAEIVAFARAAGAHTLVDAAQAVGAIDVDVHALGVDYYAFPGQKWLCGPEGTGCLYVRRDRQSTLKQTFVGTRSARPGAARYEWATPFRPGIHGLHAALAWLESVGLDAVLARVRDLTTRCADRLACVQSLEVVTPALARAGLLNIRLSRADLDACVARLAEAGLIVRSVRETETLRVSCGFFNTEAEIDRVCDELDRIVQA
jgi:L-cysteine/cystine lyase